MQFGPILKLKWTKSLSLNFSTKCKKLRYNVLVRFLRTKVKVPSEITSPLCMFTGFNNHFWCYEYWIFTNFLTEKLKKFELIVMILVNKIMDSFFFNMVIKTYAFLHLICNTSDVVHFRRWKKVSYYFESLSFEFGNSKLILQSETLKNFTSSHCAIVWKITSLSFLYLCKTANGREDLLQTTSVAGLSTAWSKRWWTSKKSWSNSKLYSKKSQTRLILAFFVLANLRLIRQRWSSLTI